MDRRVVVPGLQGTPRIKPAPIQGDTFAAPPKPVIDNRLGQLASALSSFSNSLGYLQGSLAKTEDTSQEDAIREQNRILLLQEESRAEAANTGLLPDGTPIQAAQNKKLVGGFEGEKFLSTVLEEFKVSDLTSEDVQGAITARVNEFLNETNIQDPYILNGFLKQVSSLRTQAQTLQERQILQRAEEITELGVFSAVRSTIFQGIASGQSPDDVAKSVRQIYDEIGGNAGLITFRELDDHVLSVAEQAAQSSPETAIALITQDRVGRDGTKLGNLLNNPAHQKRSQRILLAAQDENARRSHEFAKRQVDQEVTDRIFKEENFTVPQDRRIPGSKHGQRDVYTGKDQIDVAFENNRARLQKAVEQGKLTQVQALKEEIRYASRLNRNVPFVENELAGIARRFSPSDAQDPEFVEDLDDRVRVYQELVGTFPNYIRSQLSEKDIQYYDTFLETKRRMSLSSENAAIFAHNVVNPPPALKSQITGKESDALRKDIGTSFRTWTEYLWSGGGEVRNVDIALAKATTFAQNLIINGTPREDAVDIALKSIQRDSRIYNNTLIVGLEKVNLHPQWKDGLDFLIEDFRNNDERGKLVEGDLIPVHIGGNSGILHFQDSASGSVVENEVGQPFVVNLSTLNHAAGQAEERSTQDRVKSLDDRQDRMERAQDRIQDRIESTPGRLPLEEAERDIFK